MSIKQFKDGDTTVEKISSTWWRLKKKLTPDWYYALENGFWALWKWRRPVWAYRPWDSNYMLRMLYHSLLLQEHEISRHDRHTDSQECAIQMTDVIHRLGHLIEHTYLEVAIDKHPKKERIRARLDEGIGNSEDEEATDAFMECGDKARAMEREDVVFIFDTIRDNYHNWWD